MDFNITPRDAVLFVSFFAIAFSGWNLYFHSKISSLRALWKWKDEFVKEYADDQLSLVKDYATKDEVASAIERLDTHMRNEMQQLRRSIDRLRDKLDDRHREHG